MFRMVHRGDTFKNTALYETLNWSQEVIIEDQMLITSCLDTSTREFPEIAIAVSEQEIHKKLTRKMSINEFILILC